MTPLEWAKKFAGEVGGNVDPYKLAVYFSLAIDAERERCAKIAEAHAIGGHAVGWPLAQAIAKGIREA